jgi:hypothetical protein
MKKKKKTNEKITKFLKNFCCTTISPDDKHEEGMNNRRRESLFGWAYGCNQAKSSRVKLEHFETGLFKRSYKRAELDLGLKIPVRARLAR